MASDELDRKIEAAVQKAIADVAKGEMPLKPSEMLKDDLMRELMKNMLEFRNIQKSGQKPGSDASRSYCDKQSAILAKLNKCEGLSIKDRAIINAGNRALYVIKRHIQ